MTRCSAPEVAKLQISELEQTNVMLCNPIVGDRSSKRSICLPQIAARRPSLPLDWLFGQFARKMNS